MSKPGPAAVDASAAHAAAENEHRRRVTVIGAAVSVLGDGPAELRHREDDDVRHLVAEVLGEGGERGAEVAEAQRELAALGALANVRVPALHVGEGDLEADVGLDELRDLAQRLAERHARILGAVRRRDARGPGAPEHLHRVECLAPRSVQEIANALLVERLEALPRGAVVAGPDVESVERLHRDRADVPLEGARKRRADRHRAERRRLRGPRGDRAGEPAVGRALHAGRPALHVVLRVEVRARRVGRAAGVHDRERAALPERHERCEGRVKREEAVEIRRALALAAPGRLQADRRTHSGVAGISVGHHHAEPVHGSALEDRHEHLAARLRRVGGPQQESRRARVGDQRASTGLQERSTRDHRRSALIAAGTRASRSRARRAWPRPCSPDPDRPVTVA